MGTKTEETIDQVLDYLGMAFNAFMFIASSGVLPQTSGVGLAIDIVRVSGVLAESIGDQIERLIEMKSEGRELSPQEWEALRLNTRILEDKLLALINQDPPAES